MPEIGDGDEMAIGFCLLPNPSIAKRPIRKNHDRRRLIFDSQNEQMVDCGCKKIALAGKIARSPDRQKLRCQSDKGTKWAQSNIRLW